MEILFPFNQDLQRIFKLLKYNCRLVGGCVRDYLLYKKVVEDIDIATAWLPDEVIALLESEFQVLKTGLKHGTVTIIGELKYEITSLRTDDVTDGRHAVVSFKTSYEEDAKRRDFTINALYCDYNGYIYDYVNGLTDLANKTIRFIGNPRERIQEDYLRILRFLRFSSRFGGLHQESLSACYELRHGLLKISKERVTQELFRMFEQPFFWKFFSKFAPIFQAIYLNVEFQCTEYTKLSSLGVLALLITDKSYLCLSSAQKKYIHMLKSVKIRGQADVTLLFNKIGETFIVDKLVLENMQGFKLEKVPSCPVTGMDLIKLGYRGKEIGLWLDKIEYKWYESYGAISKYILLNWSQNGE